MISADAATRRLAGLRAKEVGFVFQGFNLIPTLTAQENVETALAPLGVRAHERRARAAAALDDLGLGDRLHPPAGASCPAVSSSGSRSRGRS